MNAIQHHMGAFLTGSTALAVSIVDVKEGLQVAALVLTLIHGVLAAWKAKKAGDKKSS